jgi:opacity protein-like surface antigen
MHATPRLVIRIAWIWCLLAACSNSAIAQTTVLVTYDRTKIWTKDFRSTAVVVDAGTTLAVVDQRKDWYEVILPGDFRGATGLVYKSNVDAASPPTASPQVRRQTASAQVPSKRSRLVGVVGFGQFGYARFAAKHSFQTVTGQGGDGFFGGGGGVRLGNGFFLNASIDRFTQGGERVFVMDNQVFKLGVPVSITLTPMAVTSGWRFVHDRATPYVGAGIGRIRYEESFRFADATENVDARFTSYHVLGGVEVRNGWVATAFEVEYSRVPDALGIGGASAAFQESDLGGLVARVRVLVGR